MLIVSVQQRSRFRPAWTEVSTKKQNTPLNVQERVPWASTKPRTLPTAQVLTVALSVGWPHLPFSRPPPPKRIESHSPYPGRPRAIHPAVSPAAAPRRAGLGFATSRACLGHFSLPKQAPSPKMSDFSTIRRTTCVYRPSSLLSLLLSDAQFSPSDSSSLSCSHSSGWSQLSLVASLPIAFSLSVPRFGAAASCPALPAAAPWCLRRALRCERAFLFLILLILRPTLLSSPFSWNSTFYCRGRTGGRAMPAFSFCCTIEPRGTRAAGPGSSKDSEIHGLRRSGELSSIPVRAKPLAQKRQFSRYEHCHAHGFVCPDWWPRERQTPSPSPSPSPHFYFCRG